MCGKRGLLINFAREGVGEGGGRALPPTLSSPRCMQSCPRKCADTDRPPRRTECSGERRKKRPTANFATTGMILYYEEHTTATLLLMCTFLY